MVDEKRAVSINDLFSEPLSPPARGATLVQRTKKILRYLLAIFIVIAAVEFCARLDDYFSYGAPILGVYNNESLYEYDQLGKRGKPFAQYKKFKLNSLGFRGPELHPGRVPIVCFGSSETFGLYEPDGSEFPRQIEKYLNQQAATPRFDVVNAAYPGETIPTTIRHLPEIVEEVKPQIAVIYPSLANYIWLPWIKSAHDPSKIPIAPKAPLFEWRIAENVRVVMKQILPDRLQTWLRQREVSKSSAEFGPPLDRVPDENVAMFREDLLALIAALRSRGVEPVLVTHATRFGTTMTPEDYAMLTAWRKFDPMLKEEGFLDMEQRMNAALRSVAQEEHVTLIDAAKLTPPGPTFFADFSHFTAAGADRMGQEIANGLRPVLETAPATKRGKIIATF